MAKGSRTFTIADVFKHRALTDLSVAPDGRTAAFAVSQANLKGNKQVSDVWAWSEDGGAWQVTFGGKSAQPALSPNGRSLAYVAERDDKKRQVFVMKGALSEGRPVTDFEDGVVRFEWSPEGRRLAVIAVAAKTPAEKERDEKKHDWWTCDADERRRALWNVSARGGGKPVRLSAEDEHVSSAAWTPDGERLVYVACPIGTIDSQWFESELKIVTAKGGGRRTVCPVRGHAVEGRIGVSADGKSALICEAYDERDLFHTVAKVVDLGDGSKRRVARGFDLQSVNARWLPDGRVLFETGVGTSQRIGGCAVGGRPQLLDTGPGVAFQSAMAPGAGRAFYFYSEAQKPDEVFSIALDGGDGPAALTNLNRTLGNVRLAQAEAPRWRSEKKHDAEGLLYLPTKAGARKPFPLILMPHGGPYGASLNSCASALAPNVFCAAGYACFMPNFRGSTGYGRAFTRKIVRDWGDGPFADIMAGVDALIRRGVVDRKRMAVFGGSYGGYLTAWTIGHTNRFRCAVAVAAVINNISMWGATDIPRFQYYSSGKAATSFSDSFWLKQSPLYYADRVKTPTLVITGEVDKRVPPGQSGELYRALKARGVETELLYYPREAHGIGEPQHRRHYFQRILAWINEHTLNA